MDGFAAFERHVNPQLGRFLRLVGRDIQLVRAEGCSLHDREGNAWADWIAGFGAFALGHNHPVLLQAARAVLDAGAPTLFHEVPNPRAGELAERLIDFSGRRFETVHFSNGGAEAVETAIKVAVRSTGRGAIVYCAGGFHGTTLGALACMARGVYRDDFEKVVPRFVEAPFGDVDAIAEILARERPAALMLEPLQVEAGLRVLTPAQAAALRAACDREGVLLIFDEAQTGLGRTGTRFMFEQLGVTPDILILAKALGGGLVPISATLARTGIWERAFGHPLRSNIHDSTYGGGALACAVAARVIEKVNEPSLLSDVRARGDRLWARLHQALDGHPLVARIEGLGLLGGIELHAPTHPWLTWDSFGMPDLAAYPLAGPVLVSRLGRAHIFAHVCAHDWNVLRVQPPLIVSEAECDRFVEAVRDAVCWLADRA
jgi:acetylornithine/succinyldiaminopimelate/putrescine aminotransferase